MNEEPARCIGLIGGLGPGATVHYYEGLLGAHATRLVTPDLVIIHADVSRVLSLIGQGDVSGLARYLAGLIKRLENAGAEIAAIPAVTPHICASLLNETASLPLISIVDVVRSALVKQQLHRVALFGTRFTIETDMFGQLFGSEVVRPTPEEIDVIHGIYVQIVNARRGTEEQAAELRRIALRIITRESVEAIVLAGTELALLIDEDRADYPIVDCARLHIEEITRQATKPRRVGVDPLSAAF